MESTKYQKTKDNIMKWRCNNLDAYREYQRIYALEHYDNVKDKKKEYYQQNKEKKKEYYQLNKEKKKQYYLKRKQYKMDLEEFMNILLE